MIEQGLAKIGGAKLLEAIISPGFAILVLGGIIVWKLWENKQEVRKIQTEVAKNTETLDNFNTKLEVLSTQKLEHPVTQIQEERLAVSQEVKPTPIRNTIRKTSKPTTGRSSRLDIFKQIIEDNIELRKTIA